MWCCIECEQEFDENDEGRYYKGEYTCSNCVDWDEVHSFKMMGIYDSSKGN